MYEIGSVDKYVFLGAVGVGAEVGVAGVLAQDGVAGGAAPLVEFDAHAPVVANAVAVAGVVVVDLVGLD